MVGRRPVGLFVGLLAILAACAKAEDDDVGGSTADITASFDRNNLLSDKELRDAKTLTAAQIDAFLEKNPWGKRSVLASHREDGKTVGELLVTTCARYNVNPLELLVRLQMEQGLINKETASQNQIDLAFGCGCPHSPLCGPKYIGFGNQLDCAAGTLGRSIDSASSSKGTASGWKVGVGKKTSDGILCTPENAATAALYTYTPWVGEAGGGKAGIGGCSLHHDVWWKFCHALGYCTDGSSGSPGSPNGSSSSSGGSSGTSSSGASGSNPPGTSSGLTCQSSSGSDGVSSSSGSTGSSTSGSSGSTSSSGSSGSTSSSGSSSGASGSSSSGQSSSGSDGVTSSSSGSVGSSSGSTSSSSGLTTSSSGASGSSSSGQSSSGSDGVTSSSSGSVGSSSGSSSSSSGSPGSSSGSDGVTSSSSSSGSPGSSSGFGSSTSSSGSFGPFGPFGPPTPPPSSGSSSGGSVPGSSGFYPTYPSTPQGGDVAPKKSDPGGTDSRGVEPDDAAILQGGNAPPADNAPPALPNSTDPSGTSHKSHATASDTESSGCSSSPTTGGPAGTALPLGVLLGAALLARRRRRDPR